VGTAAGAGDSHIQTAGVAAHAAGVVEFAEVVGDARVQLDVELAARQKAGDAIEAIAPAV